MITIVDYDMGNLRSVLKCFERIGADAIISVNLDDINKADKLILPGVGHFAKAMSNLAERGLLDLLEKKVMGDSTPILGICLGMQLFSKWSEEGDAEGLGWIDAKTVKFDPLKMNKNLKIPHMGWNTIRLKRDNSLLCDVEEKDTFYFVHSYFVQCKNQDDVAAKTEYGLIFTSAIQHDNIYGTQFHPEKSHSQGFQILKKFASLNIT